MRKTSKPRTPSIRTIEKPFPGYRTYLGRYWNTKIEDWLDSRYGEELKGSVDLILTSPPFPLNTKKSYGNLTGDTYVKWLEGLAAKFAALLSARGSLVIEIGNAWDEGTPTMSTLPLESLMAIKKAGGFHLCQEFICHNPARLPSPIQYVNVKRSRVKDSWTRIWWLSKTPNPKANNRRILLPYSKSMQALLKSQKYNPGKRPSEHIIGEKSFLKDNGGAIPANCLTQEVIDYYGSLIVSANTHSNGDPYLDYCRRYKVHPHPARMQPGLVKFFISFLTTKGDFVFDPFGGSNTTGAIAQSLGREWGAVEAESRNLKPSKARFSKKKRNKK